MDNRQKALTHFLQQQEVAFHEVYDAATTVRGQWESHSEAVANSELVRRLLDVEKGISYGVQSDNEQDARLQNIDVRLDAMQRLIDCTLSRVQCLENNTTERWGIFDKKGFLFHGQVTELRSRKEAESCPPFIMKENARVARIVQDADGKWIEYIDPKDRRIKDLEAQVAALSCLFARVGLLESKLCGST